MNPRYPEVGPVGHISRVFRHRFPVADPERFTDAYWETLRREFLVHIAIGQALFPIGLIVGFFLFPAVNGGFHGWDVGIGFGAGVLLAFGYQLAVCAAKGFTVSYRKLSDFSTMMYGFPWKIQFTVAYLPLLIVGIVCVIARLTV